MRFVGIVRRRSEPGRPQSEHNGSALSVQRLGEQELLTPEDVRLGLGDTDASQ
jgi:hypothetical protein